MPTQRPRGPIPTSSARLLRSLQFSEALQCAQQRGTRVPIEHVPSRQRSLSTGWGLHPGTLEFLPQNSMLHLAGMYVSRTFLPRVTRLTKGALCSRDTSCCYCHVTSLTSSHLLALPSPPASAITPSSVFSKHLGQAQGFCACHSLCLECSSIQYISLPRLSCVSAQMSPHSVRPSWLAV